MKKIYIMMLLVLTGMTAMAQTSVWHGGRTAWTHGSGTESDPYLLESADHLAYLAYVVNKGYNTEGMYFQLTTDIDLNGSEDQQWIPIGLGSRYFCDDGCDRGLPRFFYDASRPCFQGYFDGGNHRISNIYIDYSEAVYRYAAGLFGKVQGRRDGEEVYTTVIENVFVTNGTIIGGICGGIVAEGDGYTLVSRCWNGATIDGSSNCGGIVGQNVNQIRNCFNKGSVNGKYAGGIVGHSEIRRTVDIEECYNQGTITGTYAGGIVGLCLRPAATINNCFNTGTINADGTGLSSLSVGPAAGGIAGGLLYGPSGSVTNCYSTGMLTSTQDADCFLLFDGEAITFENNYYINTCGEGEGTALEGDYMRSQEFVDVLNGGNRNPVWGMDEKNTNDGFPILLADDLSVVALSQTSFKVYPNPAQGQFTVEGKGQVIVRNLLGHVLLTRQIDGPTLINMPPGLYFVTIGYATQKIVVE